jgi:hypothetical protein
MAKRGLLIGVRMLDLQVIQAAEGMEEGVVNLPSMEIARTFAVETIDYPNPLGLQHVNTLIC